MRLGELLRAKNPARASDPGPVAGTGLPDRGDGVSGSPAQVIWVETERVRPGRFQARHRMDEAELEQLAESIRTHGILQPLVVRSADGGYELVAGERRWRAAVRLGLARVPVVVRQADDRTAAELGLIENLQRAGLHFLEEAEGYRRLLEEFGMTQEDLARRLGRSQSAIANKLRLLKLPAEVRRVVLERELGERHARALLRLEDPKKQEEAAVRMAERGLSAAESEAMVRRMLASGRRPKVRGAYGDARIFVNGLREVVEKAREAGFDASFEEQREEEGWTFVIRLGRRARAKARPRRG